MVSAASTPAIVAWTPLASVSTHSKAKPAMNQPNRRTPNCPIAAMPSGDCQHAGQRGAVELGGVGQAR